MDIYIAKQAIFDREMNIYAYELLFRNNSKNIFQLEDNCDYTKQVIYNSNNIGLDILLNNKRAFINFTRENLLDNIVDLLDKEKFIIEILEDVEFDKEIVNICKSLKKRGYIIAIDDFILEKDISKVIDYIDIIKVDFILNSKTDREKIVKKYKNLGKLLLAEKVETIEEYKEAFINGYNYFQGFLFSKPNIVEEHRENLRNK
ncbi:EAL and HDOD domain-containing protein [Clostridium mediterraneense]|uniref:EAL and HDOD domain-containing protein n=1 Tax=Clostridium mediterraneense TaxID=1805472 RepID=UPI0008348FBB|nr:EAL domain-containing protein [Clostridium mediterraneense]